jgi:hypothetical protein
VKPPLTRTLWLVIVAMIMFAAGVFVVVGGRDMEERVLGGVAILGALAVVVTNVTNGKGEP